MVTGVFPVRFPHSGIPGSQPACGSPGLFAACHALLRPLVPRHPPRALCSLTVRDESILRSRRICPAPTFLSSHATGQRLPMQLSRFVMVDPSGFEPLTPGVQDRCSPTELRAHGSNPLFFLRWWACEDLNLGPHPYQGCALPPELQAQALENGTVLGG